MNLEMASKYLLITLTISTLFISVGPSELLQIKAIDITGLGRDRFSVHRSDLTSVSSDFGMLKSPEKPLAILNPSSSADVAHLIKSSHNSATSFPISARGHGHSINGQASTGKNGVIISMSHQNTTPKPVIKPEEMYVDVWGGDLWIDVLKKTLEYGLAPKSWTDYLYLSVGGTLSNGGISGQAFHYGPQISNVLELDVVTGKGEVMKCSQNENSRLFHGVLGGLGQFGIITRARISLESAPQRVRWIRVLYSSFEVFSEDQEYLITMHNGSKFDYVEGFVIVDEGLVNNWRSSFFSPSNPVKISSVSSNGSVLYCLEITKNYHDFDSDSVDQEIDILMKKLNFIPTSVFTTDLPYIDFLDRVHKAELKLRSKNLWEVPHPWLNIFVPKSRISDFDKGIFKGILGNKTSGPILIYPMNKNKWDERSSAVTPDEEVFYLVALLRSALSDGEETQKLEYLKDQNRRILEFCDEAKIKVKQYLPHYSRQEDWEGHFGDKWDRFRSLKAEYDPRHILATGQKIFENPSRSLFPVESSASW